MAKKTINQIKIQSMNGRKYLQTIYFIISQYPNIQTHTTQYQNQTIWLKLGRGSEKTFFQRRNTDG